MNCDQALEAISAALDGELSPGERAALSKHLLSCQSCRELAEDLRVLTDLLEDSDQAPPPELAPSVRKAVAGKETRSASRLRPYWRTAAAMLALCVCLGGVGMYGLFLRGQSDGVDGTASGGSAPFSKADTDSGQGAPESVDGDAVAYSFGPSCEDADGSAQGTDSDDAGFVTSNEQEPSPLSPDTERSHSAAPSAEDEPREPPLPAPEAERPSIAAPSTEPGAGFVPLSQDTAEVLALDYLCSLSADTDWTLVCDGLSGNECYYLFSIRAPEDSAKLPSVTRLAVALEDGTVLDGQDSGFDVMVNQ